MASVPAEDAVQQPKQQQIVTPFDVQAGEGGVDYDRLIGAPPPRDSGNAASGVH